MEIVRFDKSFHRSDFNCEEASLTYYIKNQVSQDEKKNLAVCFVALDENKKIIGYYTLSTQSLGLDKIPEKYKKQIPKNYNAPVILLGRLARDITMKGTKLGEYLLVDALLRSFVLSRDSIGAMAVVVDPINKYATMFYESYGFIKLPDSGKLFLPMKTIEHVFKGE